MPAYFRSKIVQFVQTSASELVGRLQQAYASDGFASQYTSQTKAWTSVIPELQHSLNALLEVRPEVGGWTILFEYPLYRLRRRIDIVILAGSLIVVLECKVGAEDFIAADIRQVEEYALDLRDFHAESSSRHIIPALWSTQAKPANSLSFTQTNLNIQDDVSEVIRIGEEGPAMFLASLQLDALGQDLIADDWDQSPYRPVPNIVEAATSIFTGHNVRSIANFDADNLRLAAARLLELIEQARKEQRRYLLVLTGVPGSGKTLAGLDVVHSAIASGIEHQGDIVYLSGNTPLVVVLREALACDEKKRSDRVEENKRIGDIRRQVRTRIQHINDFLQESLRSTSNSPPYEHVIVFDEAQRAWDEKQGLDKFNRSASEPALLLELMSRHMDWCACVCLIGSGQEINLGEDGVFGWGEAIRKMNAEDRQRWSVFAPVDVLGRDDVFMTSTLGQLPSDVSIQAEPNLKLTVPQRSFRSPSLSRWIEHVLTGETTAALAMAEQLKTYPLTIARSLPVAKAWLHQHGRGERRYGLLASSGARRLRAEGLGTTLNATAGDEIAHWYLKPRGDVRSSFALEVPANEYTCQGLELDFACLCWGGDLLWDEESQGWMMARFSGTTWQRIHKKEARRFLINSYRVLLTRAREGMVIWIPTGDVLDSTRLPGPFDATADYLKRCGATFIP